MNRLIQGLSPLRGSLIAPSSVCLGYPAHDLPIPEAIDEVIVHHSNRLHAAFLVWELSVGTTVIPREQILLR